MQLRIINIVMMTHSMLFINLIKCFHGDFKVGVGRSWICEAFQGACYAADFSIPHVLINIKPYELFFSQHTQVNL